MQLRSSWNRDDPRFLRQQPGNRDLRRCRFLLPRNIREHIHQGLVCLPVFLVETWNDVAKIGAIKLRALVDCAREEALPQRTRMAQSRSRVHQESAESRAPPLATKANIRFAGRRPVERRWHDGSPERQ